MANNLNGVSLSKPIIPIFQSFNYEVWCIKMKILSISQDLWDLVERGYPIEGVTADTLRDARKREAKTFFFIQQAVNDAIFPKFQQQQIRKRHGMHSRMVIKEQYMSREGQPIRQPINQQINESTTQSTRCQAI